jgi:hypothetical protein
MNRPPNSILVPGLTKLDKMEIEEEFEPGTVTFEDQELKGGKHGEPTTTAIVIISVVAIRALAAWLMKDSESSSIEKKVEIIDANGKTRVETIKVDLKSSTSPKADVLKQLSQLLKVDFSLLNEKE